jgi:hypothetical protein
MTRRAAHEKVTRTHWRRRAAFALLGLAAVAGIGLLLAQNVQRSSGPVTAATSSTATATATPSPSPAPATVTVTRPMSPDELRAAFIALAAHDRGFDGMLPADALPDLARQVCSTVSAGGNADAVWRAAGDLEQQHGMPSAAAWVFVDIAVTTYCPEQHMLVLRTTAAMGD